MGDTLYVPPAPVRAISQLSNVTPTTPPGTPVIYVDAVRAVFRTWTRSEPWQLDSGEWIVKINGHRGGYALTRLFVIDRADKGSHAALTRFLWRSVADGNACTCYPDDTCPECAACEAMGWGKYQGPAWLENKLMEVNRG